MLLTFEMLTEEYKNYGNPVTKIGRLVKEGKLTKVMRGLYETDRNVSSYLLAGSICGPSYLSFEFALEWYGMIPERVVNITCAAFRKRKSKSFDTPFGHFFYRDVPAAVFPLGVRTGEEGDYCYRIATPEKALCDKLYSVKPVGSLKEMEYLLLDNLRIDEEELEKLNTAEIQDFVPHYRSGNVTILYKYLTKSRKRS